MRRLFPILFLFAQTAIAANFATLDSFAFKNQSEAERTWQAVANSPRVVRETPGLSLPCPFNENLDRVYWDRAVALDLSAYTSLELDLSCDQPEALRSFAVYLQSGDGWYVWNKPLREAGRHRLILPREAFSIEGKPAGWNRIQKIRLSPWKGAPISTCINLYALTARKDSLYILSATTSTADPGERAMSERLAKRIGRWLTAAGVSHAIVTEDDAARGKLRNARTVILPLNPKPTAQVIAALRDVVAQGGHLIVCFSASPELADLMGLQLGAYAPSQKPGRWESFVFKNPSAWHVPARVYQSSWNIRPAYPKKGQGEIIARWADNAGQVGEDPAWVATDHGLWLSHILLEDDTFNKQRMLLGLLAHYDKTIWYEAARSSIAGAGKVDGFTGVESAIAGISAATGNREDVTRLLAEARRLRGEMTAELNVADYAGVVELGDQLRATLTRAFALSQRPRAAELRGVWDHDGAGWYLGDWDRTCRTLAASGFNAVFPNFQWAGLAHYPSKVIPTSDTCRLYGDQVRACLKAARKNGLQVHAWKICWNIEQAPDDFKARMKKSGRLLKSTSGATLNWLDPSRADNQELELAAIRELVQNYDVDGLQLDYIRYPPGAANVSPYAITEFVRKVRAEVKRIRPDLKFSTAVWGQYPACVKSVGQDWAAWLEKGYVDFVVPMNYTTDRYEFESLLRRQTALPAARGRIYAGIGVSAAESQLRADQVIEQINTLRKLNSPGFLLFDMSPQTLNDTLPMLELGVTRRE